MATLPAQWTDQETEDAILGSGALSYSWWQGVVRDDAGVTIRAEDPIGDGDGRPVMVGVTWARMRAITREIALGEHGVSDRIRGYITADDLDADAADVVLQICVYGAILFS